MLIRKKLLKNIVRLMEFVCSVIQDQFVVFTDVSTTTNVFCTRRPVENDDSLKLLTTATA